MVVLVVLRAASVNFNASQESVLLRNGGAKQNFFRKTNLIHNRTGIICFWGTLAAATDIVAGPAASWGLAKFSIDNSVLYVHT
jgi:hypothetical protein